MSGTSQNEPIHIKVFTEINFLPEVFMIYHKSRKVLKIALDPEHTIDCANTNNCLEFKDNKITESKGMFYVNTKPLLTLKNDERMLNNLELMKQRLLNVIRSFNIRNRKLFIRYDNEVIEVYNKIRKAKLLEFNEYWSQGNLAFYKVPKPIINLTNKFETLGEFKQLQIYNHSVEFTRDQQVLKLNTVGGVAYLINFINLSQVHGYSPDHAELFAVTYEKGYFLLVHPTPGNKKTD